MENIKPIVNIASCIRSDSPYLKSYFSQISNLTQNLFCLGTVSVVCDDISEELKQIAENDSRIRLVKEEISDSQLITLDEKAKQWASIGNQGLDDALKTKSSHIIWVESDLCFPIDLIDQLIACNVDVVAPLIFLGHAFYDSWGFRDLSGKKILELNEFRLEKDNRLMELSSVGSCVLFKSDIFDYGTRFRGSYDDGLLVGICNDARKSGYQIWCDLKTCIIHPTSHWREQVWLITRVIVLNNEKQFVLNQGVHFYIANLYDQFLFDWIRFNEPLSNFLKDKKFELKLNKNLEKREVQLIFYLDALN